MKSIVALAFVAACSASQLHQPRPAIGSSSKELLALRLRGGNSVVKASPKPKVLRGGGTNSLFMGVDFTLIGYFCGWSVSACLAQHPPPLEPAAPPLPQVPAQLLLLDQQ